MGSCISKQTAASTEDNVPAAPYALVIVGPSGVGKGTLISALMTSDDPSPFAFSVSHTTRRPRDGEKDGVHYHFTSKSEFESEIKAGKFIEHANVHGNIYGTSFAAVEAVSKSGRCCILDIDVQGARQVKASSLKSMIVFIAPPSLDELERRLRGRGTETDDEVTTRLANARAEVESVDNERELYNAVLTNGDFKTCLQELRAVAAKALKG